MRKELSFDGYGINGPDEYRSRIATFSKDCRNSRYYGKLFENAPELLIALRELRIITRSRGEKLGLDDKGPVLEKVDALLKEFPQ